MKDDQNNYIHVGDFVTANEHIRPRKRTGNTGTVISYGETKVTVEFQDGRSLAVPPNQLRVGEHRELRLLNRELMLIIQSSREIVHGILQTAIKRNVINEQQAEAIYDIQEEIFDAYTSPKRND